MKHESSEVWRERIDRWVASGLDADKFAGREGCRASTLKQWRLRLKVPPTGASKRLARRQGTEASFMEVMAPAMIESFTAAAALERPFEVVLSSGARVTVPPRFDSASLRALISLLGGR